MNSLWKQIPHLPNPLLWTYLSLTQELHDVVWTAAYDSLFAEHDRRDSVVFAGHKSLLQVEGLVVPGNNMAA